MGNNKEANIIENEFKIWIVNQIYILRKSIYWLKTGFEVRHGFGPQFSYSFTH